MNKGGINLTMKNLLTQYIYSMYFIVTTMVTVGYGDISPTNNSEIVYSIFLMLVTCGVFSYIVNEIL